ncbi:hypothetical protein PQX77_000673 [Marasmius sp. AFHP31]|nr:hypothetical protein PQX77_011062 [Marasmius sp. AFHP31]KAK1236083.1 hypothetical protein PQX77_000673 [Marasmius sp. AFHP31]
MIQRAFDQDDSDHFIATDVGPPWKSGDPLHYKLDNSDSTRTNIFEKCLGITTEFDKEIVDKWERDIDNLLVFAGLFSAVVTTFVVDTYKSLSPDPQDQMVNLLQTLVVVSREESVSDSPPAFTPDRTAIRVNIFFFLSLVSSVSASLLAILCKQWLQEYLRVYPPHIDSKKRLAIRQSRYQGLYEWRVPGLIALVPLLLEAATVLFFVGLVDLLWSTHITVAIVVMIPVVISLLFLFVTTILPPIFLLGSWTKRHRKHPTNAGQCPYKTPLGWTIIRMLTTRWLHLIDRMLPNRSTVIPSDPSEDRVRGVITFTRMMNWTMYDINSGNEQMLAKGITWLYPFISSGDFASCLDGLKVKEAVATFEELLPFLRVVRELSVAGQELPMATLDRFLESAKEVDHLSDVTWKDIIVVSTILYRRNVPSTTKIQHCLERCIRIMNNLLESVPAKGILPPQDEGIGNKEGPGPGREFSATVLTIIVFLVSASKHQLDRELSRHIEIIGTQAESPRINFIDQKDIEPLRIALELNARRPTSVSAIEQSG